MWIRTMRGDLVNLERADRVVAKNGMIIAQFGADESLILQVPDEAAVEEAMLRIGRALQPIDPTAAG